MTRSKRHEELMTKFDNKTITREELEELQKLSQQELDNIGIVYTSLKKG